MIPSPLASESSRELVKNGDSWVQTKLGCFQLQIRENTVGSFRGPPTSSNTSVLSLLLYVSRVLRLVPLTLGRWLPSAATGCAVEGMTLNER